MSDTNPHKELVGILFPGVVKNEEKALQCLGGIRNISQTFSVSTKKRLGLTFQPDNPFAPKIYGDLKKTTGVLLKVKVKKIKDGAEIKREVISTSVLGQVKDMYHFDSMCDFQYLPINTDIKPSRCLIDEIIPKGTESPEFLAKPSILYLPPPFFTRSDRPSVYCYTEKRYSTKAAAMDPDEGVHNKTRTDRTAPYSIYRFNLIDEYPTEPNNYFLKQIDEKKKVIPEIATQFETVKKLFDERPMWSLNMIKYTTKYKLATLKLLMPCFAYFLKNGPWRVVWVRYGYDPRKEPGSRIYQILDFRMRATAGVRSLVMSRDQLVHFKKVDRVKSVGKYEQVYTEEVTEGSVIFRPGLTPAQRQIFYQYCDILIPEVQALVSCEPAPGSLCHATRGWLPHGTGDTCRELMFKQLKDVILAANSADVKFERGSSDEDQNSEGEGLSDSDGDTEQPDASTSNT